MLSNHYIPWIILSSLNNNITHRILHILHRPNFSPEPKHGVVEFDLNGNALLLWQLLAKTPRDRLGGECNTGATLIRRHPFFRTMNWRRIEAGVVEPHFVPDVSHFSLFSFSFIVYSTTQLLYFLRLSFSSAHNVFYIWIYCDDAWLLPKW